jgi:hypothetical protein
MHQRDLCRAIARVTGESVRTIQQLGFSTLRFELPISEADAADSEPQTVDWDQLERERLELAASA